MKLKRALRSGLTVAELIEELEQMDPNLRVVFAYTSSDHWGTQVARVVTTVDETSLAWNEYHSLPAPADSDEASDKNDIVDAVVLNLDGGDGE